uniref:Ion_trans_2 domain-containing protein n=1 Tax=Steinernema glaseri TaxID=37863 RepID=A0A1I7ZYS8_9BILA
MGIPISYWEPTWSAMEAVYFSCISILSIGYGDYVPHSVESTAISMSIVLVGLIFNSMLVDVVAGHFIEMPNRALSDARCLLTVRRGVIDALAGMGSNMGSHKNPSPKQKFDVFALPFKVVNNHHLR